MWRTTAETLPHFGGSAISIHVPRVEDDIISTELFDAVQISIHVPRVEDDSIYRATAIRLTSISIHVPRVEDDKEDEDEM